MIRPSPCSACPYRQDVPPGIWAAEEYEKLPPYDLPTAEQPTAPFACHATPEHLCHGWAVVGGWELLALRLRAARTAFPVVIPDPPVPLFASGREAAEHGLSAIEEPPEGARDAVERLLRKHHRLGIG